MKEIRLLTADEVECRIATVKKITAGVRFCYIKMQELICEF